MAVYDCVGKEGRPKRKLRNHRVREELDRMEEQLWQGDLTKTTAELREAKITDEEIDRFVLRRRRKGRS
jgi:hypothetical protein